MEVFSLLKHWKGSAGPGGGGGRCGVVSSACHTNTTSLVTTSGEENDDEGSFFDLEFSEKTERENETVHEEEEERRNDVVVGGDREQASFRIANSPFLRVLMLGLKRSKSESTATTNSRTQNQNLFTVMKLKPEVPMNSLVSRHSSDSKDCCDEKPPIERSEAVEKYLSIAKLPQMRSRQAEETAKRSVVSSMKRMKLKKNIGNSKSAVVHSIPNMASSKRRDELVLQEEDGIQSAILHCKKSFNASRSN